MKSTATERELVIDRSHGARLHATVVAMAVVLLLVFVFACGGQTAQERDTATTNPTGISITAHLPTSTAARDAPAAGEIAATPTTAAPATSRTSLDEYLTICGIPETEVTRAEEVPLKEISEAFRVYTDRLESVEPPSEVVDWHDAVLPFQKAFRTSVDDYLEDPGDQTQDEFLFAIVLSLASKYQADIDHAILEMDSDVRARMTAAGCIEEDTSEAILMPEAREEIQVGDRISGTLEEPDRIARLQFRADEGQSYLIEVTWEAFPEVFLLIKDPPDPAVVAIKMYDSDSSPLVSRWTAWETGTFHVDVQALEGSGSFSISIAIDTSLDNPAGVNAIRKDAVVEVSWEPVEGAEYYKVYHDDRGPGCQLRDDGTAAFCDELATNVMDTSYVHDSPDPDENYYWVAACNGTGCSKIDSSNPTSP